MEPGQVSHDFVDGPPLPPPKLQLDQPRSSQAPPEYGSSFWSPSLPEPTSHFIEVENSLPPPVNGTSEAHLTPPSQDLAVDDDSTIPPSPSGSSFKSKRPNPLTDLVESEQEYIDILAAIIRKVAGAWSRNNFPPKELDLMFRGIEAIYKANRSLLNKLKDLGPTPNSPKELGDLLMRWIDDLDAPYTKYCGNFAIGFDDWQPVATNTRLQPILANLSTVYSPPSTSENIDADGSPIWTLDALFSLPRGRLKYYKKLYSRLLKGTQAGRSDHKLLTGAVNNLDNLLNILAEREIIIVGVEDGETRADMVPPTDSVAHLSLESGAQNRSDVVGSITTGSETAEEQGRRSVGSAPYSSLSSGTRASRETDLSRSAGRSASSTTMSMPASDLERRLSTERTVDLFTLNPKAVRLQINPPSLHFTRTLRLSCDAGVHFAPRSAPDFLSIHTRGHIFLLTDLFLVCERMTPDERQQSISDGQDYDMFLLYPPLAAKHLRVFESPERDNVMQVQILKKEILELHTDSRATRDHLISEFTECIEEASYLSPQTNQPPPPVPPPKQMFQSSSDPGLQHSTIADPPQMPPAAMSDVNLNLQSADQRTDPNVWQIPPRNGGNPHLSAIMPPMGGQIPFGSSQPNMPLDPQLSQAFHQAQNEPLNPYVPPPRGASQAHLQIASQIVRPATAPNEAPGERLILPNYPQQYPARNQLSDTNFPSFPGPYPNGRGAAFGSSRPPSEYMTNARLHKTPSAHSLRSQFSNGTPFAAPGQPPRMVQPAGYPIQDEPSAVPNTQHPLPRIPFPPGQRGSTHSAALPWGSPTKHSSPPGSPLDEQPQGPVISTVTAQFKCKVFLQLHHGQWKSLGSARLKLYMQRPTNTKQLVVEADSKDKTMLISTIVLTDGVERVGKTGVAIEISDKGARTGIVYMIQLRNESSAGGLFDSLLAGSDRAAGRTGKG